MMQNRLPQLLSEIPNEIFFNQKGDPNFNRIFVEVARRLYEPREKGFTIPADDFLSDKLPNLSSFQRSVAKERQRRKGRKSMVSN